MSDVVFVITFHFPCCMLLWICVELLILECRFFSDLVTFLKKKINELLGMLYFPVIFNSRKISC